VLDADRQARDAEANAARARAEAERAERQAAEAGRARDMERAAHEDQIREADRLDPDVDHRSDDYVPDAEPQRFDTQTGEPLQPGAQRGSTGFEPTQGQTPGQHAERPTGQHAATPEPASDPLTDTTYDDQQRAQQPPQQELPYETPPPSGGQQPPEGTPTR
jgi:hypothetical protein